MRLGILFWFYKDLDLCVNRGRLLRKLNPRLPIYGLFGGEPAEAGRYGEALAPWLDDFYAFPEERPATWKWLQGDRMIARWFAERGAALPWDSLFVAQWDLLLLEGVDRLCGALEPGQLLLPGLRPIREVENWWYWVRPGSPERADYENFMAAMARRHALPAEPQCCNFITAAFPRAFLDRYADIPQPEVGFLEYKIPLYAQVWGMDFCRDHPFQPVWYHEDGRGRLARYLRTFHAEKQPIRAAAVALNALSPWGSRVFHPYVKPYPLLAARPR